MPHSAPMSRLELALGWRRRTLLIVALPLVALLAAGLWIAVQFLHPLLPARVVFAAGPEHGALHGFAERYRELLARQGVTLEVKTSRGVGDNLALLRAEKDGADAGFLLAGLATDADAARLASLGSVAYAPLWVLYRGGPELSDLAQVRGRSIAVGEPGSGLAAVLGPILAANGIAPSTTRIVELPFEGALASLLGGKIDVAFLGEGPSHRAFVEALAQPETKLLDFSRAEAYARRFPWLHALHLPAGTLDFERSLPPGDVRLIASTVILAGRSTLHPTVVDLLVDAAREVHGGSGFFERRGEFPDLHAVDRMPMSEQAVRYAQSGPTLLRRYLPLWLADFLQRLFTLALPFVLIAIPAIRWVPNAMGYWIGTRIEDQYARLLEIERRADSPRADRPGLLSELDRLDARVAAMSVPVKFAASMFQLRTHARMVRATIADRSRGSP